MKFKIKEIAPKIYLVLFKNQYQLCMTFVRIQEFYESPKFRNKAFTLEEFMEWWSMTYGNGIFTYPAVWGGFNVPGKVVWNWMGKVNCEFTFVENELLNAIDKELEKKHLDIKNVYVIATCDDKKSLRTTIRHEIAHALYYLNKKYKLECDKLIKETSKKKITFAAKKLIRMGYCAQVVNDEIQAYFSTSVKDDELKLDKRFAKHFNEYIKELKI